MKRVTPQPLFSMNTMKTLFKNAGLIVLLFAAFSAKAQVSVTATAGTLTGSYSTLRETFDSINSGRHMGVITLTISANITETASAVLNASGTGSSSYTSVLIEPTGGVGRTIAGSFAAPLIDLNGADNVRINGIGTGGNNLTFQNTNTGNSGVTTIRFANDATGDTIQNLVIRGSSTSINLGTVFFGAGVTTGNDNNVISNCTIDAAGSNLPVNAIYCSGSTTAGQENSNVTISNCNIANYFSATLATAGILLNSGATDWTISDNRFYQAATRTFTTANTHRAINIASSGNNFNISGNIIGYANSGGTGTYTMAGTIATRFVGIDLTLGTTVASSVQNNTITAISLTTSSATTTGYGVLCGILIADGKANIGTITGNTIGSASGTGAITVSSSSTTTSAGLIVGINSASVDTIMIQNNTMGALTSSNTTATPSGGFMGINVSAVTSLINISNNTIGNASADNIRTGASGVSTSSTTGIGINMTSTPVVAVITNNTIRNITTYGTGTAGFVRGIQTSTTTNSTANFTISTNTIYNLRTFGALAGYSTTALTTAAGIHFASAGGSVISENTIYNIKAENTTATTQINSAGIALGASSVAAAVTNNIYGNKIYDITNAGVSTTASAPAVASGILILRANNGVKVYNNMISLGTGQTTNTSFVGIWGVHTSTPNPIDSVIHNTINITGTVTSGAMPSFGFYRGDFSTTARTATVVVQNNLITNDRSGGTGKHYAISNNYGATTPSATGWGLNASNGNILNASATTVGAWGSTDYTFSGWKTISAGDTNSFSATPVTYVNPANDLHINTGLTPTFIESSSIAGMNVDVDFDGIPRPGPAGSLNGGGFVADIGADEYDGVPIDIAAPVITLPTLPSYCSTGDRTFSASIFDLTGVNVIGSLVPRVYYRKMGSSTYYSQAGQFVSGNPKNSIWNFTIVTSDMGGLNTGDSVYFYLIAQDSGAAAVNVSSLPAGVVATDVNSPTAPPPTERSYLVGEGLSGSYTLDKNNVASTTNFASVSSLELTLRNGCLLAPVTVDIVSGSGPYISQLTLPEIVGASAINTFTLDGHGDTLKYAPTSGSNYVVRLNGTDYLTIKNLNIVSTDPTYGWGIHLMNGANHDSILNCRIDLSLNTNSTEDNSAGIVASSSSTDVNAEGNNTNYLTVAGSTIIGGYHGIIISGSTGNLSVGNKIVNDTIRDFYSIGMELVKNDGVLVQYNDVHRKYRTGATALFNGIELGSGCKNAVVDGNKIHDTHTATSSNTLVAYGVYLNACDAGPGTENKVTNNLIYNFNSLSGGIYGFYCASSSGVMYYHNTVVLNYAGATAGLTRGFFQSGTDTAITLKNNIFYITRGGTGVKYCIYKAAAATITSDYNVLYMNAPAGATNGIGYNGSEQLTMADWQLADGNIYDQHSLNVDPWFTLPSAHNYIPLSIALDGVAANVGVTTDVNGTTRTSPGDLGAIEFNPPTLDAEIKWVGPVSPSTSGSQTVVVNVINHSPATTITDLELSYTDGTTPVDETFSGLSIPALGSQQLSFSVPYALTTTKSFRSYIRTMNGAADLNPYNDTTGTVSVCIGMSGGNYTINSAVATGGTNFQTFANAISAMSSCGINGPIVFDVDAASGPYAEQILIPKIAGASAVNTITINGNGRIVTAVPVSATRYLVRLDGADYVTIKDLKLISTAADYGWGIHFTNGADYDSIVNCTIDMSLVTSTTAASSACVVVSGSTTSVTTDGAAGHNTLKGNTMIGGYQGIVMAGETGGLLNTGNRIIGNIIRDFYANGIDITETDSTIIEGNNISRAIRTAVTTFEGIELGAGNKNARINANKIHDTHNSATTQSGTAYGIYSTANDAPLGSENHITNNLFYNFNSGSGTIYALYNSGSNGAYYYYNTIVLNNTASTAGATRGFYQTTEASNIRFVNNIIAITRGGTGTKHCLYFNEPTSSIASDNNILYLNAAAGTNAIGYFNSNQITLVDWKSVSGGAYDQQSLDANPLLLNGNGNLIPYLGSPASGAGSAVSGVTEDFLGVTRSATTPTIGAYEQTGDVVSPIFNVPLILNTSSITNRTLSGIVISDVSGVNVTSYKPRLYFKKSSDANDYVGNTSADNGWKWVETPNTTTPFSFTMDYSLLYGGTGVVLDDVIQYFVVAQDNALSHTVGINSGVFSVQPDSVALTAAAFPVSGTIASFKIVPSVGNTSLTVGAVGANYTNLSQVSDMLRNNELTGDLIFELQPDYNGTTGEVFPVVFDPIAAISPGYTVTIRPSSAVSTILLTAGDAGSDVPLISLNGTSNILFDGRPGGLGDTSNIMWRIVQTRTAANTASAFRFINDAQNNTLQYLKIESGNTVATSGTIEFATTTGTLGNSNNTIRFNTIRDRSDATGIPANAIYSAGTAGAPNRANSITGNNIYNFTTSGISVAAIGNGNFWDIDSNHFFYNNATAPTTAQTGILFAAASNNNTIANNSIGGTTVNAGGTAWIHNGNTAFTGISASFDSLSTSVISQNVVSNISKTNTGAGAFTGIIMSRGNALIYQNLIGDTVNANSITLTGTGAVTGISNTNPLANTLVTISYNRVANITSSNAGTGTIVRGISYTSGSPYPACNIMYNKTFKLSTNSAVVGYAAGSIAAQGIYCFPGGYGPTSEMAYNTVYDIIGTNTSTTAATNVSGITATNFVGSIHHNVIYDIKNHSLDSGALRPTANGMYFRFLDPCNVHNNMVSLTNNPSDSVQLNGIMVTGANGGTHRYYYNSIYIGNGSGFPVSSFAFHRGENSTSTQSYHPIVMKNNLFINTVTSPGLHYAIGNEGTRPDSSWISNSNNYNNFYAVNPANLTLWGTTTGDLTSWKALSLGDSASISKAVDYTNPATADLHLSGASIGDFDLAGIPVINYTTDFDGETRNPVRPYMGADENLATPVPVTLTKFIAQRSSKNVVVYWSTASEINANKFIIQASADGKSFKQIGTVKAKGNSSTLAEYKLTHFDAQLNMNNVSTIYYRMISVDIDGSSTTSKVVKVDFNSPINNKLDQAVVYPNPFNDNIHLIIPSDVTEMATVTLIDIQGKVILSHQYSLSEGLNNITLDMLDNLEKGLFFVQVILKNETRVVKILKD